MIAKNCFNRLVMASLVMVGFGVVWGIVLGVLVGSNVSNPSQTNISVNFLADGTPLLYYRGNTNNVITKVTDLQGNLRRTPGEGSLSLRLTSQSVKQDSMEAHGWYFATFRVDHPSPIVWYFVGNKAKGLGYFVEYDVATNACLGYLSLAGFQQQPPLDSESIPYTGVVTKASYYGLNESFGTLDVQVVGRNSTLYRADLKTRKLKAIPIDPEVLSINYIISIEGVKSRVQVAMRTLKSLGIFNFDSELLKRFEIPAELQDKSFAAALTDSGDPVLYWFDYSPMFDETETRHAIFQMAKDGTFRKTEFTLPRNSSFKRDITLAIMVAPSPVIIGILLPFSDAYRVSTLDPTESFSSAIVRAYGYFWPAVVAILLIAIAFAFAAYRRLTRYRASTGERILWTLFVLVTGFPGWIGFRFSRPWPPLGECENCHATVPQDRERCVKCGVEFAEPARKGTEVFA